MHPIKNYREEERECATTSGKFNYFSQGLAKIFAGSSQDFRRVQPKETKKKLEDTLGPCAACPTNGQAPKIQ